MEIQSNINTNPIKLLTPSEVAESFGLCLAKVYDMMNKDQIASVQFGRSRRIPLSAAQAYIEEQVCSPAAPAQTEAA